MCDFVELRPTCRRGGRRDNRRRPGWSLISASLADACRGTLVACHGAVEWTPPRHRAQLAMPILDRNTRRRSAACAAALLAAALGMPPARSNAQAVPMPPAGPAELPPVPDMLADDTAPDPLLPTPVSPYLLPGVGPAAELAPSGYGRRAAVGAARGGDSAAHDHPAGGHPEPRPRLPGPARDHSGHRHRAHRAGFRPARPRPRLGLLRPAPPGHRRARYGRAPRRTRRAVRPRRSGRRRHLLSPAAGHHRRRRGRDHRARRAAHRGGPHQLRPPERDCHQPGRYLSQLSAGAPGRRRGGDQPRHRAGPRRCTALSARRTAQCPRARRHRLRGELEPHRLPRPDLHDLPTRQQCLVAASGQAQARSGHRTRRRPGRTPAHRRRAGVLHAVPAVSHRRPSAQRHPGPGVWVIGQQRPRPRPAVLLEHCTEPGRDDHAAHHEQARPTARHGAPLPDPRRPGRDPRRDPAAGSGLRRRESSALGL
jgi:hypothetical protein